MQWLRQIGRGCLALALAGVIVGCKDNSRPEHYPAPGAPPPPPGMKKDKGGGYLKPPPLPKGT